MAGMRLMQARTGRISKQIFKQPAAFERLIRRESRSKPPSQSAGARELEGTFFMNKYGCALALLVAGLLTPARGFSQTGNDTVPGRAIVTIFAKHNEVAPNVAQQYVSVKLNGKDAPVVGWAPFKGADDGLELVLLIEGDARNLGRQFQEIQQFVQGLGPNTKVAIGYMENGRTAMAGPLTDPQSALKGLHLPAGPGSSPYFSISDLAERWPSLGGQNPHARREVVLLSDGVDPNNRRFDPDDPYVQSAIHDAVRAGLVIYSLYWRSRPEDAENSMSANGGQSLLGELTQATGGFSYWSGTGNPVSFQPFFADLMRRFASQYALEFAARPDRKPSIQNLKLKVDALGVQVTAPQQTFVPVAPK